MEKRSVSDRLNFHPRLAGLRPAGALIEVMNADGTMARLPQLLEIAGRFGLKVISIADLIAYRQRNNC